MLLDTPVGSSASGGGIERANQKVAKQCRTLRSLTEEVYAVQLDMDHKLIPWHVRHAAWLITHFQINADGKTPYERLRNRAYHGEAETVHHKDLAKNIGKMEDKWYVGGWLGKSMASDEH